MKKLTYIIISLAVVIATGCSLEKEPLSGPSADIPFANEQQVQAAVLSAYKSLANNELQYEPTNIRWMDQLTDIGSIRTNLNTWELFQSSTVTSTNHQVEYLFARMYKGIARIHLVLDQLDGLRDNGTISEDNYNIFKAELLCLRAYHYDILCQVYGDVPFTETSLSLDNMSTPRKPYQEIIASVIEDMDDELIDMLPVQWEKTEWGTVRLSRVAAYALKARILLEWAHLDWSGNEKSNWQLAAEYSRKAIQLADGIHELTPLDTEYYATHSDGEPDPTPLFGFDGETNSMEWIWSIEYSRLAASNVHHGVYTFASRVHNGAASAGPSMAMMDTFQTKSGKRISDEDSGYDWKKPWNNRDPRLDLYCIRHNSRCMGIQFSINTNDKTVRNYITGKNVRNSDVNGNKSEYGPNGYTGICGFLWRKYMDPMYYRSITNAAYEDELDVPVIRYAELLLIEAEANIEWEGGDLTRAKKNINQIRKRAGMPDVTVSDRDGLRSALRYERKVELCAEGFRWFDIRRWKVSEGESKGKLVAEKAYNTIQYAPDFKEVTCNAKPQIDSDWTVTYDGTTFDGSELKARQHTKLIFNEGDEFWPFPFSESNTNPALKENK